MFSRKHRLAKTRDVKMAFAQGRSFFNPFYTIKFVGRLRGEPRFTIVVSTKVSKKAVVRNRIKRILREYIRLKMNRFAIGDYVIVVKPKLMQEKEDKIVPSFKQLVVSARLKNNED